MAEREIRRIENHLLFKVPPKIRLYKVHTTFCSLLSYMEKSVLAGSIPRDVFGHTMLS